MSERHATIVRHRAPVPGGLWNSVTWTSLDDGAIDRAIEATLAWYGGSCRWWTGPGMTPPDLDRRLRAAGFEGEPIPAMVCELDGPWDGAGPARARDRAV